MKLSRWLVVLFAIAFLQNHSKGQEFDEEFDHWPIDLRIGGTIILHNKMQDGGSIKRACLRHMQKEKKPKEDQKPRATILTSHSVADFKSERTAWLKEFDEASTVFSFKDVTGKKFEKDSAETGVVLFVVNSTFRSNSSQTANLAPILKKFINDGGVLVADAHGSKWLSKQVVFGEDPVPLVSQGLNLVPDSIVETDFEDVDDERRIRSAVAAYPRSVGIGIRKNTCLVLRGRKLSTFEYGEASFMLAANARQPQRNHTIGAKKRKSGRLDFENNLVDLTEWRRDAIDRTLPAFPPETPGDPVVENGTLVIVGGGGMPENLMNELVEMAGGKEANMVYVPCSERDSITGPQRTVEYWKKLGVKSATFIHTKDRNKANSDKEFLKPLENATGIWFGGGRQWNFSDSYYGTRAHKLMKDVLKRGGVIGGSSAGASIQARYLARATPIANYRIMAPGYERGGLGFISGVAIDQHFSQRGRQKDMTQLMEHHPQLLGIGIDETTAIVVKKSEARVVGKGKVHFYDRRKPVYPDKPDYVALAKGSTYDLKARKILWDGSKSTKKSEEDSAPKKNDKDTNKN